MAAILAHDIFKFNLFLWKWSNYVEMSQKFVPMSSIENGAALVQVMPWHRTGDKPIPEPMLTQFTDAYMQH